MPVQKGQVLNTNGSTMSVRKQHQWTALVESLKNEHTERFDRILRTCDDQTFLTYYCKILEYWRPKLSAQSSLIATAEQNTLVLSLNASEIPALPSNIEAGHAEDVEYQPVSTGIGPIQAPDAVQVIDKQD